MRNFSFLGIKFWNKSLVLNPNSTWIQRHLNESIGLFTSLSVSFHQLRIYFIGLWLASHVLSLARPESLPSLSIFLFARIQRERRRSHRPLTSCSPEFLATVETLEPGQGGCEGGGGRGGGGGDLEAGVRSSPLSWRCQCSRISSHEAPGAGWPPGQR